MNKGLNGHVVSSHLYISLFLLRRAREYKSLSVGLNIGLWKQICCWAFPELQVVDRLSKIYLPGEEQSSAQMADELNLLVVFGASVSDNLHKYFIFFGCWQSLQNGTPIFSLWSQAVQSSKMSTFPSFFKPLKQTIFKLACNFCQYICVHFNEQIPQTTDIKNKAILLVSTLRALASLY